jgi:pimeloyl-ACP methyl ester carboxylesterase
MPANTGATGFRAGLTGIARAPAECSKPSCSYSGKTIDVPSIFISGSSDWGVYQRTGAVEKMNGTACTRMMGVHLLDGAGHWVQQEQPEKVTELLLSFLRSTDL